VARAAGIAARVPRLRRRREGCRQENGGNPSQSRRPPERLLESCACQGSSALP
jgi:hypothetical protein